MLAINGRNANVNANIHNFKNNSNFYHNNLNGLETKFDNFHQFISENNLFDVIAITETSQKKSNNGFLSNVEIEGYNSYAIASNTSKGGSLLYINNKYKNRERTDLSIQNDLFEAIWVEIINVGRRNTICCSLYRHPNEINSKYETFLDYLDDSLEKILARAKIFSFVLILTLVG